jgi:mannitol/fructose-specific phosphotransferase system IIA component (Ntr-type)
LKQKPGVCAPRSRPASRFAANQNEQQGLDLKPEITLEIGAEVRRNAGAFMNLGDILSLENIVPGLPATNRWEAIDQLIQNLVATNKIRAECREAILAVVKKRESSMSTGIGFGIGIPHASTDLIQEVVGALGRSTTGIDFDALDNQPVNIVMLFLVPQGQFQKHLHTLAGIAKLLHIKEFRQELEQATDAAAMYGIIKKYSTPK